MEGITVRHTYSNQSDEHGLMFGPLEHEPDPQEVKRLKDDFAARLVQEGATEVTLAIEKHSFFGNRSCVIVKWHGQAASAATTESFADAVRALVAPLT